MNTFTLDRKGNKQQFIFGKHKYERPIVLSHPKHKLLYGSGTG